MNSESPEIPKAQIVKTTPVTENGLGRTKLWWLTALCALVTIGLFLYSQQTVGEKIVIEFTDGYGIKPEDRLKHLGIDVGSIEKVELSKDLTKVLVSVRLLPNASKIAQEGSQFWIVRPVFNIDSVAGLDTVLGAKYLAVLPASNDAPKCKTFVGLDLPPATAVKEGSLEIQLDGATRGGLSQGAPILYRGYRVGSIVNVGLASDARSVRARCAIDPEYRHLIRNNTKFWNHSGWRLNVGLSGVKLDADSIGQIVVGGIEMATPGTNEPVVNMGHRFILHAEPEADWVKWTPSIGHGQNWSKVENKLPQPIRMALRWQERSWTTLGFKTSKQISGWCLPLDDGSLLCFREQLTPPSSAKPETVTIELAGLSLTLDAIQMTDDKKGDSLVRFKPVAGNLPVDIARWPVANIRSIGQKSNQPINVVLVSDDPNTSIAVDQARLTVEGLAWHLDNSFQLANDTLGMPVIAAESNDVIGLLFPEKKKSTIFLIP